MSMPDRRRYTAPSFSKRLPETSGGEGMQVEPSAKLFLHPDMVTSSSGSSYIETDDSKILVSIHGPKPINNHNTPNASDYIEKGRLDISVHYASFSLKDRRVAFSDPANDMLAILLKESIFPAVNLSQYAKSTIEIAVLVVEGRGPEFDLSSAILATSRALMDSGIEIFGLVMGDSQHDVNNSFNLACLPAQGTLTHIDFSGSLSVKNFEQLLQNCYQNSISKHSLIIEQS